MFYDNFLLVCQGEAHADIAGPERLQWRWTAEWNLRDTRRQSADEWKDGFCCRASRECWRDHQRCSRSTELRASREWIGRLFLGRGGTGPDRLQRCQLPPAGGHLAGPAAALSKFRFRGGDDVENCILHLWCAWLCTVDVFAVPMCNFSDSGY